MLPNGEAGFTPAHLNFYRIGGHKAHPTDGLALLQLWRAQRGAAGFRVENAGGRSVTVRTAFAMPDTPDIDIDYVANLARLALTAEEKVTFARQLGDVLAYIEKLKQAEVSGVEPTAHAFDVCNVWAEDVPQPGLSNEDALRNAPAARDGMIVVPKVVE